VFEGKPLVPVHANQLTVHTDGRGPGGQPEHTGRAGCGAVAHQPGDANGHKSSEIVVIWCDDHRNAFASDGVCRRSHKQFSRVIEGRGGVGAIQRIPNI